jgi:hypothetical protein
MMSWKQFENEEVVAQSRYYPIIFLEGLRKAAKIFSDDSLCRGWDSNRALSEHKFIAGTYDGTCISFFYY